MNIGVFGKGKTGAKVIEMLGTTMVYDSQNLPTNKTPLDALIVFIPASGFLENFNLLLTLNCPIIIGTTGIEWTQQMRTKIKENKKTWIFAANFSLGMLLVRKAINQINSLLVLLKDPTITISETHHTDKKDAPSGTALLWNEWLENKAEIKSFRRADIVGTHEAHIETTNEKISIIHEAKDRELFAQGAIWCAKMVSQVPMEFGLHSFESIVDKYLKDRNV